MLRAGHVEGLSCTTQAPCVIPRTSWFCFLLFVLLSHVFSSDASFADGHSVYLEKFPSFVVLFCFFFFFPRPAWEHRKLTVSVLLPLKGKLGWPCGPEALKKALKAQVRAG